MFPPKLSKEEFRELFSDDIYCEYVFMKLSGGAKTVAREVFVDYAGALKDVYMWVPGEKERLRQANLI